MRSGAECHSGNTLQRTGAIISSDALVRHDAVVSRTRVTINTLGVLITSLLAFLTSTGVLPAQTRSTRINNIVLVHGAWVDGSGWKPVYELLVREGFHVTVVQEPLTSFSDDVAATRRILAMQDGPCILVGHSYGGSVITEAGTDSHVVGLVYIAAHMPDAGESEAADGKRYPSALAKSDAVKKTPDGYSYLDPLQFHRYFAADLPSEQASFEAKAQALINNANFSGTITTPAWRSKPSWMLVPTADKTINPDLERWYASRAHSQKVEVNGASHSVYVSRPHDVAKLIEQAAREAKK